MKLVRAEDGSAALRGWLDEHADQLQVTVDTDGLDRAGAVAAPTVRTLDAIHLVSAAEWSLPDVQFVTYDRRLAIAPADAGMTVVAPADPPEQSLT